MEFDLTKAAVMVTVPQWPFVSDAETVQVHPDGASAKHFDMRGWLENARFEKVSAKGTTREVGRYTRNRQRLLVNLRPGRSDVVASAEGHWVVAEAEGGCINTRPFRKGLEAAQAPL